MRGRQEDGTASGSLQVMEIGQPVVSLDRRRQPGAVRTDQRTVRSDRRAVQEDSRSEPGKVGTAGRGARENGRAEQGKRPEGRTKQEKRPEGRTEQGKRPEGRTKQASSQTVRTERSRGSVKHRKQRRTAGFWKLFLWAVCIIVVACLGLYLKGVVSEGLGGPFESPNGVLSGVSSQGTAGETKPEEYTHPLICIDAGHGYDDPGATHANLGGLDEKDITLDIVLRLANIMKEKGYSVVLTRDSDIVPDTMKRDDQGLYVLDPYDRCDISNNVQADLFISVHCNSFPENSSVSGMQLYYTEAHTEDNAQYAELLADSMEQIFGTRPRVIANPEDDSYVVNRLVNAPSVLVETGFVTNPGDAALMLSEQWRQEMAEALAEGMRGFLEGRE